MAALPSKQRRGRPLKAEGLRNRIVSWSPASRQAASGAATIFIYLLLGGITWSVFGQTVGYGFINFDDDLYVYDTPEISRGITINGILSGFTHPHAHNWHPLTTISHMLDCQLYGLNAGGHHFTNVLLHTIVVLLLFRVLRQMTGAVWESAVVAALFAVHPLHVESVAWVSERKDMLSGMFFLLTIDAYVRYVRGPSFWRYSLVAALLALGLMSKPMLVTVPFILLLLDYWPLRRFEQPSSFPCKGKIWQWWNEQPVIQRLFLEKIPLLALSAGSCVVTFIVQKQAAGAIESLPFRWRAENAVVSYVTYLWKTFWPARLAVFYPHPNNSLPTWEIILAVGFLVAITAAAIIFRSGRPYIFTGWLWYLGMLVPVIGFVQVGEQGHADRYTYLPHIGLFLLVVWTVADISAWSRFSPRFVTVAAVAGIVAFGWCAFFQTRYWRDSETLWNHALAVTSNNDVAHNNLGFLCVHRGELDKAISHFEAALKIRSNKAQTHYNLGSAFIGTNLGNALVRKGQLDEAIVHYQEAINLQPDYADAYYNLGSALLAKGNVNEAIAQWQKALAIWPNDSDAHTGLGNALLQKGSLKEAITHYEKALEIAPQDVNACNNMAWVLATSSDASIRDGARAVSLAQEAVELSSGKEPNFLRTLAAAYAENKRFSEAIITARRGYEIATGQNDSDLAQRLARDAALYRTRTPLRRVFSSN
jgi:tetratricopeptide (TPR) repeat protein